LTLSTPKNEQNFEYELLSRLAESSTPRGATSLFLDIGVEFNLAQASIGRKLMELDSRGLTRRAGTRGRLLTADGEARRQELERYLTKQRHNSDLLAALGSTDKDTLLDVLVARRALEREIAHLAALNASPDDITALRDSIIAQERCLTKGRIPTDEDNRFHDLLAYASRNKVLLHSLQLVRAESSYTSLVAFFRKQVGGQLVADHRLILECVASGSPEASERAVVAHLNKLIDDVRRYFALNQPK